LAALGIFTSIKSDGPPATAATSSKTTLNPASAIKTDWTNKFRSATGKAWGWCDG
jgi:hypothetical protein